MTINEQLRYWGAGLAALLLALWLLSDALTPFLAGMAVAYFTDPLADRLERAGMSRALATVVITALFLVLLVGSVAILLPLAIDQVRQFVQDAPELAANFRDFVSAMSQRYFPDGLGDQTSVIQQGLQSLEEKARAASSAVLKGAWSGGLAVVDFLGVVLIMPIVSFYLLLDWDRMVGEIDSWLPRQHAGELRRIARDIDRVLAGFVRGQLSVCLILGAFYAVALMIIGLKFGLLIGLVAGLISFIPFVGSIVGGGLSLGVAAVQYWNDPLWIGVVAAVFVLGQAIEGNVLTPRLVGGSIGLHPVWLMFALAAFGSLMGFAGLLVAVPAAAVIGVLGRYALERYFDSRLYLGPEGRPAEGDIDV